MNSLDRPTLIFIRHGETKMNTDNDLRGWDDPPLDVKGHQQAHEAASKLVQSGIPIHHVYTGVLQRTKQTGAHVTAQTGVNATGVVGLNPWDYGDFTGQKESRENRKKLKFLQDRPQIKAPNGESYGEFLGRYRGVLNAAADYVHKFPEKALVLVTHSRNLYPTQFIFDGKSKIPTKDERFKPGSVHKLEWDGSGERERFKFTDM